MKIKKENPMRTRLSITLLLSIFGTITLFAQIPQRKVEGLPELYDSPIDIYIYDESQQKKFLIEKTGNKDRREAWMVTSDRDNNPVYEKPSKSSRVIKTIDFRDQFYVVDEEGGWIEIISAKETVDKLKIVDRDKVEVLGWVPKEKMLMWSSGVVDPLTKIHKKAFLLNRADAFEGGVLKDQNFADFFNDPNSKSKQKPIRIYDYYFVFKKDTRTGMYLLSREANITPFNVENNLVGWVDSRRLTEWNTRICLEPNFEEKAFQERKNNPSLRARAFRTFIQAGEFAERGSNPAGVFWKDDPVTIDPGKLAETNPRRFKGNVIRFPMLSVRQKSGKKIFRSGLIGTIKVKKQGDNFFAGGINETSYSPIRAYLNKITKKTKNVNLFFVIEATDKVHPYKPSIISAIQSTKRQLPKGTNVRYGTLLYRDIPEERITEYQPLTSDLDKVTSFIEQGDFINKLDRDDYTALYYGLLHSLQVAGFNEEETNIIVLIGNYGDYKADRDRKAAADRENHRTFIELADIADNLSEVNAHLHAIQLRNDGYRPSRAFTAQAKALMSESAKRAHNRYTKTEGDQDNRELLNKLKSDHNFTTLKEVPKITEEGKQEAILTGGRMPGILKMAKTGSGLSSLKVEESLLKAISESIDFNDKLLKAFRRVIADGESLDVSQLALELDIAAGRLAPAMVDYLNKMLKDKNINKQDLLDALDEKYKLYTEVHIPKSIRGANYPLISYVLFMPEKDLRTYKNVIDQALSKASSADKKRELLFDTYKELVVQFSGEEGLRELEIEEVTIEQVQALIQGVRYKGLDLRPDQRIPIGDIMNERQMSDSEVDELLYRFSEVSQTLKNILRLNESYEFMYSPDPANRYYWIPIEKAF